jgi:hypothetical protein
MGVPHPWFPVGPGGFHELHAAFLNESRMKFADLTKPQQETRLVEPHPRTQKNGFKDGEPIVGGATNHADRKLIAR